MRFVVFGVGAVGGTIAGKLARAGLEVTGIARGEQLEALQRNGGLTVETPEGDEPARFASRACASEIRFREDDCVLLCVKSQHTLAALASLRASGVTEHPVVCVQNGVENERFALRLFPNVYGVCVMLPSSYLEAGTVRSYSLPKPGILDIGRYPHGVDATAEAIAAALEQAGFSSRPDPAIMRSKYGKLLMNLGNAVQATLGPKARNSRFSEAVRAEGEAVLRAAGIEWVDIGFDSERRAGLMSVQPVKGSLPPGSSSWQSLARGSGSIETDYLNGEIVLLGRRHAIPTPANAYFASLAAAMLRAGEAPGTASWAQAERYLFSSRR